MGTACTGNAGTWMNHVEFPPQASQLLVGESRSGSWTPNSSEAFSFSFSAWLVSSERWDVSASLSLQSVKVTTLKINQMLRYVYGFH